MMITTVTTTTTTIYIKADNNGRTSQLINFSNGNKVEIPLKNGTIKWFDDSKLIKGVQ